MFSQQKTTRVLPVNLAQTAISKAEIASTSCSTCRISGLKFRRARKVASGG